MQENGLTIRSTYYHKDDDKEGAARCSKNPDDDDKEGEVIAIAGGNGCDNLSLPGDCGSIRSHEILQNNLSWDRGTA